MAGSSFLDVCRFTPTLGGTTDWTYSAAVTGYQSPAAAGAVNGAQYSYRAESADLTQWEVGLGAYNTGTGVLARTTVLFNSLGTTAKINFSTAPQVAVVAVAEDLPGLGTANNFSKPQSVADTTASTSTNTGALKVSGGVGVIGALWANTVAQAAAPSSALGIDFTICQITVPGSSSAVLADFSGLVVLSDTTSTGQTGVYILGGSNTASYILLGGGSAYVAPTTTPAANKYSIGYDGTHNRIYNGNASAITFTVAGLRTRNVT